MAFGRVVRDLPYGEEIYRVVKFGIVGLSGTLLSLIILYLLTDFVGLYYLISNGIALEVGCVNNFICNDLWTYRDNANHLSWVHRFCSFQSIAMGGFVLNMVITYLLTEFAQVYYLYSNMVAILVVFVWNYVVNKKITWKEKYELD